MSELLASSTPLGLDAGRASATNIRGAIASSPYAEAATELVRVGRAPTSLRMVAALDRASAAAGIVFVLLFGLGYLLAG